MSTVESNKFSDFLAVYPNHIPHRQESTSLDFSKSEIGDPVHCVAWMVIGFISYDELVDFVSANSPGLLGNQLQFAMFPASFQQGDQFDPDVCLD